MPTNYIPVVGTWGWPKSWSEVDPIEWWRKGSYFEVFAALNGLSLYRPDTQFLWDSRLNGADPFDDFCKEPDTGRPDHRAWIAGGVALSYFIGNMPQSECNIICHSHGLQVVLYAMSQFNLKVNNLISVCSPIRADMKDKIDIARHLRNINRWTVIQQTHEDKFQRDGRLGDGDIDLGRPRSKAELEINIPEIDHSLILRDPTKLHWWVDELIFDIIKNPNVSS